MNLNMSMKLRRTPGQKRPLGDHIPGSFLVADLHNNNPLHNRLHQHQETRTNGFQEQKSPIAVNFLSVGG